MPIATSSVLSQLRNTSYTQKRVPFFPDDEWCMDKASANLSSLALFGDNFLNSNTSIGWVGSQAGIDSYGSYIEIESLEGALYENSFIDATNYLDQSGYFFGKLSPRIKIDFKMIDTIDLDFFMGFTSKASQFSDSNHDSLYLSPNSWNGIGLAVQANGNFQLCSNNGTGQASTFTAIDTIDSDVHTFYLESDYANNRWGYSWDKSDLSYVSSNIPDPTHFMTLYIAINSTDNTPENSKFVRIYALDCMQRRRL